MNWWEILKSSRGEAYVEFVKEYGPEVELDSLRVSPHEDEKQVQIDSPDSEWVVNYAILSSGKEQFTFESMIKYLQYSDFVEGMFEQEYPKRYQELLDMARGALPESNTENLEEGFDVPVGLDNTDARQWLVNHEFYAVNNKGIDMSARVNRKNLLKSLIEYHEGVSYEDAEGYLSDVSITDISEYRDLLSTFISWSFILTRRTSIHATWARLRDIPLMMGVARDINSGDLDDTEFMRYYTGPIRIRRIRGD